jgi:hypothetical protein
MAFDAIAAPQFYEDFLEWFSAQTEWTEERDYDSLDGTTEPLAAWFMEMKETFPPMNGPYYLGDDKSFADEETEQCLTDYAIASGLIYGSFAWSVAEEAAETAAKLAAKHQVALFNPQTGDLIHCDSMVLGAMRTERHDDKIVAWEQIEREILTLDSPERGRSHRDNAFITIFFKNNRTDEQFMQCIPDYPQQPGFFQRLFGAKKNTAPAIASYTVEVGTGEKIYSTQVPTKEHVQQLLHAYYTSRQLPDTTSWQDTGII